VRSIPDPPSEPLASACCAVCEIVRHSEDGGSWNNLIRPPPVTYVAVKDDRIPLSLLPGLVPTAPSIPRRPGTASPTDLYQPSGMWAVARLSVWSRCSPAPPKPAPSTASRTAEFHIAVGPGSGRRKIAQGLTSATPAASGDCFSRANKLLAVCCSAEWKRWVLTAHSGSRRSASRLRPQAPDQKPWPIAVSLDVARPRRSDQPRGGRQLFRCGRQVGAGGTRHAASLPGPMILHGG